MLRGIKQGMQNQRSQISKDCGLQDKSKQCQHLKNSLQYLTLEFAESLVKKETAEEFSGKSNSKKVWHLLRNWCGPDRTQDSKRSIGVLDLHILNAGKKPWKINEDLRRPGSLEFRVTRRITRSL